MSAPVRHTCPYINKLIKKANDPIKWLSDALKMDDIDAIKSIIEDAIYEIEDIEGMAEDLRSDNDSLRTWGHDCESRISELECINSLLESEISSLESN